MMTMSNSISNQESSQPEQPQRSFEQLPPAAQRALKEAEQRRADEKSPDAPREIGGRGGKDPARFGDWEIKGRTIDF